MSSGFKVETKTPGNGSLLFLCFFFFGSWWLRIVEWKKMFLLDSGQKPRSGQTVTVHYTGFSNWKKNVRRGNFVEFNFQELWPTVKSSIRHEIATNRLNLFLVPGKMIKTNFSHFLCWFGFVSSNFQRSHRGKSENWRNNLTKSHEFCFSFG